MTFSEVVHKKLLPLYLSIGVSEEKFWDSTPYDLEPYLESYKLKQRQWDAQAWQYNMYTMCAVQTAVATVLVGKPRCDWWWNCLGNRRCSIPYQKISRTF